MVNMAFNKMIMEVMCLECIKSDAYPTRESVIEMYNLDENEQVYLADELLKIEKMAFEIQKGLV
jgi:hypothetical protein